MMEAMPMTDAMSTMEAMPMTDAMSAECIPWYRARHEQYHQYPENYQPLPSHSCCFVFVVHDASLSRPSYSGLVVRTIPQPRRLSEN